MADAFTPERNAILDELLKRDAAGELPPQQSAIVKELAKRRGGGMQGPPPPPASPTIEQMPMGSQGAVLPGPAGLFAEQELGKGYEAASGFVKAHTPEIISQDTYRQLPLAARLALDYGPQAVVAFGTGTMSVPVQMAANLATVPLRQMLGAEQPGLTPYVESAGVDAAMRVPGQVLRGTARAVTPFTRPGQMYQANREGLDQLQALARETGQPAPYESALTYIGDQRRRVMDLLKYRVTDLPDDAAEAARAWVRNRPIPTEADITRAYQAVGQYGFMVPLGALTQAKRVLAAHEDEIASVMPGFASRSIRQMTQEGMAEGTQPTPDIISNILDALGRPMVTPGTTPTAEASFEAILAVLKRTGQRIGDLRAATNTGVTGAREQLSAASKLYGTLQKTLDDLASNSTIAQAGRDALKSANTQYKIWATTQDLAGLIESKITDTQGTARLNPGALLDALRRPVNKDLVDKMDDIGISQEFLGWLEDWTKKQASGRQAVRSAQQIQAETEAQLRGIRPGNPMGELAMGGAMAGGGALAGSPVLGAAAGATYVAAERLASFMMTPKGQRMIQNLMESSDGYLSPATMQLLSGLTRSGLIAVRESMPPLEGGAYGNR